MPGSLAETAPAKVNLTLRVLGRRADGYHEIESLVAFADRGDRLTFMPGGPLTLAVRGPRAAQAGETNDNLVLKACRALAALVPDLGLGAFELEKTLPVAAGLGGGSADAAAALRLVARANKLPAHDPRLYEAARATGADVPVCLDPRARLMRGIGEQLSAPVPLPPLAAVLVNPGAAVPTKAVFAAWRPAAAAGAPFDAAAGQAGIETFLRALVAQPNDLEAAAVTIAPVITEVLAALRTLSGCRLARMSGSGATCFGVFASADAAQAGAERLLQYYPRWWICPAALG